MSNRKLHIYALSYDTRLNFVMVRSHCKNCLPYNLYCVGGDVKHCTIQSFTLSVLVILWMLCTGHVSVMSAVDVDSSEVFTSPVSSHSLYSGLRQEFT